MSDRKQITVLSRGRPLSVVPAPLIALRDNPPDVLTLRDLSGRVGMLAVVCKRCDRRGRVSVHRLTGPNRTTSGCRRSSPAWPVTACAGAMRHDWIGATPIS